MSVEKLGHVYRAAEAMAAGVLVTPDEAGAIRRARQGDPHVGAMGLLDDVQPGDLVRFEWPRGGLGRKVGP
ncbi:MAG TPA: hypothetical protein PLH23_04890 [Hyphomonadaceae bacterium]|nr:hypothetical protein [Hyphomonadaceae bacterium]